jgi:hypothetical protein
VLKGSYQIEDDNPNSDSHPAIMLVSAYIVERGLILEPFEVDAKTNEIKALPPSREVIGRRVVVVTVSIEVQSQNAQYEQ